MPYPQASPVDTGEVARDSVTEGAPWAIGKPIRTILFFCRERISPLNHRNILIP